MKKYGDLMAGLIVIAFFSGLLAGNVGEPRECNVDPVTYWEWAIGTIFILALFGVGFSAGKNMYKGEK